MPYDTMTVGERLRGVRGAYRTLVSRFRAGDRASARVCVRTYVFFVGF